MLVGREIALQLMKCTTKNNMELHMHFQYNYQNDIHSKSIGLWDMYQHLIFLYLMQEEAITFQSKVEKTNIKILIK